MTLATTGKKTLAIDTQTRQPGAGCRSLSPREGQEEP